LFGLLAERFRALQADDPRKVTPLTNLIMFKTLPTTKIGKLLKGNLVKEVKERARGIKELTKTNDDAILAEPITEGA